MSTTMTPSTVTPARKAEIFDYLTELRDGGGINMFSAGPYLMDAFDLNKHEARDMFMEWIEHCRKVPT